MFGRVGCDGVYSLWVLCPAVVGGWGAGVVGLVEVCYFLNFNDLFGVVDANPGDVVGITPSMCFILLVSPVSVLWCTRRWGLPGSW